MAKQSNFTLFFDFSGQWRIVGGGLAIRQILVHRFRVEHFRFLFLELGAFVYTLGLNYRVSDTRRVVRKPLKEITGVVPCILEPKVLATRFSKLFVS